jgi:hypothetical protein
MNRERAARRPGSAAFARVDKGCSRKRSGFNHRGVWTHGTTRFSLAVDGREGAFGWIRIFSGTPGWMTCIPEPSVLPPLYAVRMPDSEAIEAPSPLAPHDSASRTIARSCKYLNAAVATETPCRRYPAIRVSKEIDAPVIWHHSDEGDGAVGLSRAIAMPRSTSFRPSRHRDPGHRSPFARGDGDATRRPEPARWNGKCCACISRLATTLKPEIDAAAYANRRPKMGRP